MTAAHFPDAYDIDTALTLSSYMIGFVGATFAIWLTTRKTLPCARLILGAVLMGPRHVQECTMWGCWA